MLLHSLSLSSKIRRSLSELAVVSNAYSIDNIIVLNINKITIL